MDKPITRTVKSGNKYPLRQMKVGESFDFPYESATRVSVAANQVRKTSSMKFKARKIDETTGRIWRIE